jgi:hypothetical protein
MGVRFLSKHSVSSQKIYTDKAKLQNTKFMSTEKVGQSSIKHELKKLLLVLAQTKCFVQSLIVSGLCWQVAVKRRYKCHARKEDAKATHTPLTNSCTMSWRMYALSDATSWIKQNIVLKLSHTFSSC